MTDAEQAHALKLLQEARDAHQWGGPAAAVPIDPLCLWREEGKAPCRQKIQNAIVLLWKDGEGCHVLALCEHHTACLQQAVALWRQKN